MHYHWICYEGRWISEKIQCIRVCVFWIKLFLVVLLLIDAHISKTVCFFSFFPLFIVWMKRMIKNSTRAFFYVIWCCCCFFFRFLFSEEQEFWSWCYTHGIEWLVLVWWSSFKTFASPFFFSVPLSYELRFIW